MPAVTRMTLLVFLVGLCLAPRASRAQDTLPSVLKPADIFTDAVQVVETLPIVNTDDATRTLYYFDPAKNEWRSYAYPKALRDTAYWQTKRRSDGKYLINELGFPIHADELWVFDPVQGTIVHPEAACGTMKALSGEGQWIPYENPLDNHNYMCFTETGELGAQLPQAVTDDNQCGTFAGWRATSSSPNKEWAVFANCVDYQVTLYSYNVPRHTVYVLGTLPQHDVIEVEWFSATRIVVHDDRYQGNPDNYSLFAADVDQPNSLRALFSQLYHPIAYHDNPPRYEFVEAEYSLPGGCCDENATQAEIEAHYQETCGLQIYYPETRQKTTAPYIPGICGTGMIIPDGTGDRLYRSLNYTEGQGITSATLLRFNWETGKKTALLTDEIQWIDSVSPDGRYVILAVDHNAQVVDDIMLEGHSYDIHPTAVVFDLRMGKVIYEIHGGDWYYDLRVTWIDGSTFYIQVYDQFNLHVGQIVKLTEGGVDETVIDKVGDFAPDFSHVLERVDDEMSIYNMVTGKTTSIIPQEAIRNYDFETEWQSNDTLLVTVKDKTRQDDFVFARWRVRVS